MPTLEISIMLNGQERSFVHPLTITSLLAELDFAQVPVLVELNGRALFPREFPTTSLENGDRVELVRIVAGG